LTVRYDILVLFYKLNTKYITSSQNTTKLLYCVVQYVTQLHVCAPFFRPLPHTCRHRQKQKRVNMRSQSGAYLQKNPKHTSPLADTARIVQHKECHSRLQLQSNKIQTFFHPRQPTPKTSAHP